ncbi:serine/threonine-protein kinase [Catenuloplanes atrovinosus]|uniref:non-specific serine/threonine protein kinase n=1 Tax=Catenuloplanes atrovinosus TaxID=137266 RepID=A0AAE4CB93_9ACTN|nr:serine/threonine-protein kinase [Catenuloplanes atrovinosus]MDR7277858.1 serine/threonine protein kinase [Catenuloplanes atrovinosus]
MTSPVGQYQRLDLIGRGGGMGEVWRARDLDRGGRVVALKLLAPDALDDTELRERFLREMEIAADIENPHVVVVYDFSAKLPEPYIAMRYIDGRTMADEIAAGTMTMERTVTIVEQIASALAAAHERGLRHRDVKPSNIMLERGYRAGTDHAYLIDWGIAQRIDTSDLTRVGQMVGTPAYVAPERLASDHADGRADIYSLAVVLYEGLAGRKPFGGRFTITDHRDRDPDPLPETVPPALRAVVMKGLAKRPADRYDDARAFGDAVYRAWQEAPAAPAPARRTPAVWPLAAGGGVGAVAGIGLLAADLVDTAMAVWALPALVIAGVVAGWALRDTPEDTGGDGR